MKKLKLCLSRYLLCATKLTRFVIKDDVKVLTLRIFKSVYSDRKIKLSSPTGSLLIKISSPVNEFSVCISCRCSFLCPVHLVFMAEFPEQCIPKVYHTLFQFLVLAIQPRQALNSRSLYLLLVSLVIFICDFMSGSNYHFLIPNVFMVPNIYYCIQISISNSF